MILDSILIGAVIAAALWTALASRLLRSGIALAATSALVAIVIYRLNSPVAAIFELSVCAGLIPVIFITTISFTKRLTEGEAKTRQRKRMAKFWFLPVLAIIASIALAVKKLSVDFTLPISESTQTFQSVFWAERHMDLIGQIVILLAGAIAVVVFFKEARK